MIVSIRIWSQQKQSCRYFGSKVLAAHPPAPIITFMVASFPSVGGIRVAAAALLHVVLIVRSFWSGHALDEAVYPWCRLLVRVRCENIL